MLTVDQYLIKSPNNTFALKVSGSSMEKAGIMAGDLLLVEKRSDARPGQIIVAHLPSGFTVKRLIEDNGQRYLKAESSKEYQIRLEEGTEIWGIVIGIIRKY
jgi:repressor LexA